MAENDTSQERTEEPTGRRLEQAREKGQVARSKELGTSAVLIAAAVGFLLLGPSLSKALYRVMELTLSQTREQIFDPNSIFTIWYPIATTLAFPVLSLVLMLAAIGFAGNIVLGGMTFSSHGLIPKASKMSPMAGFKRMFGVHALVELAKGFAKFSVVAACAYLLLTLFFEQILRLSMEHFPSNVYHSLDLLAWMFLLLCCSTLLIAVIDVPFQLWHHKEQLKMTKQEVKDEYKDTEGKPEVKGRVRQMQREIAMRRMMAEVPKADVIVVNPEHYAVALKYDAKRSPAPFVLAKGVDSVAFKIREIAREYDIAIVSAPPLARAIYHTTKLNQQIPDGLFTAVAQVLAYVFQLRQYRKGRGKRPTPIPHNQPIPDEFKY